MATMTSLKRARLARGLKQAQVVRLIMLTADKLGISVMAESGLLVTISHWENGRRTPDPSYRRIFREIYGRTNDELGFPPEPDSAALDEDLADRLVIAKRVDAGTIEMFRRQTDAARHSDRRFGSSAWMESLRRHIAEMDDRLRHSLIGEHREPLAAALADAATLAGWNALDAGSPRQAWDHHELAKSAAREARSDALLAHATGQQAIILVDIGQTADALILLEEARALAGDNTPRLLRAWLAATVGEVQAAAGDRDGALRAFDEADTLLPTEITHPELPFLFLGGTHLTRWRGNALSQLGEPEAIHQLNAVLTEGTGDFLRARAKVHVDLAYAYSAAGDRDGALTHAQQARRLVTQLGSVRIRRRLAQLVLPGSASALA